MYLLVDECCAKSLVQCCEDLGHVAQRSIHVQGLGVGASDSAIFTFVLENKAILITENITDFMALGRGQPHAGMIFLPSVRPTAQRRLLREIIERVAMPIFGGVFPGRFIQAEPNGIIISFIE